MKKKIFFKKKTNGRRTPSRLLGGHLSSFLVFLAVEKSQWHGLGLAGHADSGAVAIFVRNVRSAVDANVALTASLMTLVFAAAAIALCLPSLFEDTTQKALLAVMLWLSPDVGFYVTSAERSERHEKTTSTKSSSRNNSLKKFF